jgi:2-keto-3-deoxy-L-fuconate dehydrogenase
VSHCFLSSENTASAFWFTGRQEKLDGAPLPGFESKARVGAKEGASEGIRVNAIAPAGVETAMWRSMPFFADAVAQAGSEAAGFAEIARQIAFLLSDDAATITGATLTSDGGYLL